MNPLRRVVLAFSLVVTLPAWLTTAAQSPNNTPARGKNGGVQERKLEAPKREGFPQQ